MRVTEIVWLILKVWAALVLIGALAGVAVGILKGLYWLAWGRFLPESKSRSRFQAEADWN